MTDVVSRMTNSELLERAIESAARVGMVDRRDGRTGTNRGMANRLFGVDERTVQRWLSGDRAMPAPARVMSAAIVARPEIAFELERAAHDLQPEVGPRLAARVGALLMHMELNTTVYFTAGGPLQVTVTDPTPRSDGRYEGYIYQPTEADRPWADRAHFESTARRIVDLFRSWRSGRFVPRSSGGAS